MINRLRLGLVAAVVFAAALPADACWARRNCCAAPCAPAPQFVEQKVTAYRCVQKEREVEVTINRMVPREVDHKYTVLELVSAPVKQKVTRFECFPVEKTYTQTVMEMRTVEEKRKVVECEKIMKEVVYKYIEMVPSLVKEKKLVTTWKCDKKVVEEIVPVCRKVLVRCEPDPCAGCLAACLPRFKVETVVEHKKVCRTVTTRTPVVTEVECVVRKCTPVERTGKRMVCELKPTEKIITVPVCKAFPVEKTFKCTVMDRKPITEEVTVNVCKTVAVEKICKKTVYDCVPTKQKVKQCYTEMVPYETVVRVPVCPPAPRFSFGCCR